MLPAMEPSTLHWRPVTVDDAAAIVRLDHATLAADDRDDPLSLDEVLEEFTPSWSHPETRSLAAVDDDGELAGLAWLHLRPGSTRARVTLLVRPQARSTAVPRRLLAGVYERALALRAAGDLPDEGTVEVEAQPHQSARVALLEAEGFAPVRIFHELERDLALPLDRPSAPDGVHVLGWGPRWSELTRLAHVEAFADHWGSVPPDEEAWEHHFVGLANFRSDLSFVAVHDDEVVGYLLADVWEQDWALKGYRDAWIGTLGTRRAWRGRGIASALLLTSMHRMRAAGMEYASLGVDSESLTGADRLYAGHGFVVRRARITYVRRVSALAG